MSDLRIVYVPAENRSVVAVGSFGEEIVPPEEGQILANLFSDAEAFLAATIGRGTVGISGALFIDSDLALSATVSASYAISGALFADNEAFFAAVVAPGAISIAGTLFADSETYFSAAVSVGGNQSVSGALHVDIDAFFGATIGRGTVNVAGSMFADIDVFQTATLTFSYQVAGSLYVDTDAFFDATVSRGAVDVSIALHTDTDAFFAATVAGASSSQDWAYFAGDIEPGLYPEQLFGREIALLSDPKIYEMQ